MNVRSNLNTNLFGSAHEGFKVGELNSGWIRVLHLTKNFLLIMIVGLFLVSVRTRTLPNRTLPAGPVWGAKPVLGYFALTPSLADKMKSELRLSEAEFLTLRVIAQLEDEKLRSLEELSHMLVADPSLALEDKRTLIAEMDYNRQVMEVVSASQETLERTLSPEAYRRLVEWVESRWIVECDLHGSVLTAQGPRTFQIFATRYDAGDAYAVALPDKCLKFTNGGNRLCEGDGYQVGQLYSVFVSYKESTAATVSESGPWNVDDNYWATLSDPTPRRMFADLALGMPEAQAAYFNNYNGGVDQFGRVVTAPFGIDLARQVSIDIGLMPGTNDWIDVSFLWTEGWDGSSAPPPQDADTTAEAVPTSEVVIAVQTAIPQEDGSLVHEVQQGQALWSIAAAYGITVADLLRLNGLSEGAVIFPGDRLTIHPAQPTSNTAASETPSVTATKFKSSATTRPSRTPTLQSTEPGSASMANAGSPQSGNVEEQASSGAQALVEPQPGVDLILIVIFVLILLGLALVFLGTLLKRSP